MNFLKLVLATGASLLFLALVFIPMEKVFAAKPGQKTFRPNWFLDLCFFLGQYLLWSGLVLLVLNYFSIWLDDIIPSNFRNKVAAQPIWLQSFEVLLFSDLLIYWGHRLQHKVDFLWRFHKVHHSAEHLDWLAAHREHPLDSIYTIGIINLPALVFGFPLEVLAGIIAFRGIWAIYIHSNVRLPIGPLKKIIGAPELHHWHHDLDRDAGNYANISPLMDILFGTYVFPPHEPESYGIKEDFPKNYVGQLIYPMLPGKLLNRMRKRKQKVAVSSALQKILLFTSVFFSCYAFSQSHSKLKTQHGITTTLNDSIPQARGFINDYENLYTDNEEKILDSLIRDFEKETTIQIAVVTIDTTMTSKENLDDFTLRMANTWGVGHKNKNNGILVAISKGHLKMRIQNGYGIEQILSDSETKQIVDDIFIAHFKRAQYFEGTREGIKSLIILLRKK